MAATMLLRPWPSRSATLKPTAGRKRQRRPRGGSGRGPRRGGGGTRPRCYGGGMRTRWYSTGLQVCHDELERTHARPRRCCISRSAELGKPSEEQSALRAARSSGARERDAAGACVHRRRVFLVLKELTHDAQMIVHQMRSFLICTACNR